MKKLLSASLVIALLACSPLSLIHAEKPVKGENGKGTGGGAGDKGKPDTGKGTGGGAGDKGKPDTGKGTGGGAGDKGKPETGKGTGGGAKDGSGTTEQESDSTDSTATTDESTQDDSTVETPTSDSPTDAGTVPPGKKGAVQKAVKTKKELIELRQQLKKAGTLTDELKAKYEELTSELEAQSDLSQALEVQKELLDRFYTPGDQEMYDKLGQLYEKTGDTSLKTFINGEEVEMEETPFIEKGRALVPVRAISRALKADVAWNAETRTVEIVRGESKITLYLDKNEALINGETVTLETSPVLKKGRIFLPLRFIGESLKADVNYQPVGDIIIVEDGAGNTPTTEAPTTEAPTTEAPTTEAPTTEAPTTETPTTTTPTTGTAQ